MGGTQSSETNGPTTVEPNRPKGPQSSQNCTYVIERSSRVNDGLGTRISHTNQMSGTQSSKTNSGSDNYRPRTAANGDYSDSDDESASSQDSSSLTSSDSSVESSDDYNKNKHEDKKIKFIKCKENFYCSDKGVFYDDSMIRIKFKMKKENPISWGLSIMLLNKTKYEISSVDFKTFFPDEALKLTHEWIGGGTYRANDEKLLKFEITCLDYFEKQPILRLTFVHNNLSWKIQMNLPIYIHKFLAPSKLDKLQFKQKWNDCLLNRRENCVSFQATKKFIPRLKKYLEDFGFMVHNDLTSKPEILYVGTAIIHTKSCWYHCLFKLRYLRDCKESLQEYEICLRTSQLSKHFKSSEHILSILYHEIRKTEK